MGTMIGGISVFFFQAEDGIRDYKVTGVQTCALPILITLAKAGAGSALMAELKTPTSPLVLSKPQTHAARVALPHARAGSRLWWGVGGLGGVAIAAALWWLAPWRAWLTPTLSAPPPPRDTVRVSQAQPPAVPTDTTSGRGAPVPAPPHVARPPSRARVSARSPAAGAESAAGAPGGPRAGSGGRWLRARARQIGRGWWRGREE